MARSSVVYYVTWPVPPGPDFTQREVTGGPMRAAFTVKHELETWLDRHPGSQWGVWRIADGHHWPDAAPIRLDPRTLEPSEPRSDHA